MLLLKNILIICAVFASVQSFAQYYRIVDNKLVLPEPVLFKAGSAELLPESETVLKNVKLYLDEKTFISLMRIEGHVATGNAAQDQTLSEARAQTVILWLIKAGASCKRLMAVGFGNTKPVVENTSPDKEHNTRIEFAVAALAGHLVGGLPADGGGKVVVDECKD